MMSGNKCRRGTNSLVLCLVWHVDITSIREIGGSGLSLFGELSSIHKIAISLEIQKDEKHIYKDE